MNLHRLHIEYIYSIDEAQSVALEVISKIKIKLMTKTTAEGYIVQSTLFKMNLEALFNLHKDSFE